VSDLRIFLFGRFRLNLQGQDLTGLFTRKTQELFSYLVLHRDRPIPRETLAGLLWGDTSTAQSKKSLRQTLWQLQAIVDSRLVPAEGRLLSTDVDTVQCYSEPLLWLDVAAFEQSFSLVHGVPAEQLDDASAQMLHDSVQLYNGDLLEGWYQDWCLYERERLQNMLLIMLDKLMAYSEARRRYEDGLFYGMQVLKRDRARERTHRQLMRLYYLAGDRTGALRQYEHCAAALDEELGVKPSKSTLELCEMIRADLPVTHLPSTDAPEALSLSADCQSDALLAHLKYVQASLVEMQHDIQDRIQAVELAVNH
jgi:DNA-binding SARP family transcriptional activator